MRPVLSSDLPRVLEVGAAPHATGIANLHLASGDNLPGLGREGELCSAFGLAKLIAGSADGKPRARARRSSSSTAEPRARRRGRLH